MSIPNEDGFYWFKFITEHTGFSPPQIVRIDQTSRGLVVVWPEMPYQLLSEVHDVKWGPKIEIPEF